MQRKMIRLELKSSEEERRSFLSDIKREMQVICWIEYGDEREKKRLAIQYTYYESY